MSNAVVELGRIGLFESKCLVSVGAVVLREGRILINRRVRGRDTGHWRIPSGFPGPDESFSEAAVREVEEETRVKTTSEGLLAVRDMIYDRGGERYHEIHPVFKLNWVSGEPVPDGVETDAAEFVSLYEFRKREELSSVYVAILEKALSTQECLHEISSLTNRPDTHLNNAFV